MGRRATATVGLTALAAAVVLLIAMTADHTPATSARQEPEPTHHAAPTPTVDASQAAAQARQLARLAKKAKAQARLVKLFQDNQCWKDEAPAGVVPSHAVVTLPGEPPTLVTADVGYGIWLDGDPGELHGFCP